MIFNLLIFSYIVFAVLVIYQETLSLFILGTEVSSVCQLIGAILFLLLNNLIINLNFLSCVFFSPIQFPSYLCGCALTALHTTHSHWHHASSLSTEDCSVLQKVYVYPQNQAQTTSSSFVTLSTNTNMHHNCRHSATGPFYSAMFGN